MEAMIITFSIWEMEIELGMKYNYYAKKERQRIQRKGKYNCE